jgi:hypothetical protein
MTPEELDALKVTHYELTTLSGLFAYDVPPGPSESFQIDVSAALARLEQVLPAPPWEVPDGPLYVGREGDGQNCLRHQHEDMSMNVTPDLSARRPDGWPFCPACGDDELWSLGTLPLPACPSAEDLLKSSLGCYSCSWRWDPHQCDPPVSCPHCGAVGAAPWQGGWLKSGRLFECQQCGRSFRVVASPEGTPGPDYRTRALEAEQRERELLDPVVDARNTEP